MLHCSDEPRAGRDELWNNADFAAYHRARIPPEDLSRPGFGISVALSTKRKTRAWPDG